jgi:peptidoglycan/xylan/chitin deacetylase (PgdA/CDA1 family)
MKRRRGRSFKARIRRLLAAISYATSVSERRLRGRVLILGYHRVLPAEELARQYVQPGMYVRSDTFEVQMGFIKERFEVLSLAEALEAWRGGDLDAGRCYCVVTFDDGWIDNYRYAYPVLRRLGIPATIFLATGFIGTDRWYWPERLTYLRARGTAVPGDREWEGDREVEDLIERWKARPRASIEADLGELARNAGIGMPRERVVVNWDEVAEMSGHGISFGSHSVNHALLTAERIEDVRWELRTSLEHLERAKINHLPVFAYPNGASSREIASEVRAAGYVAAVTTEPGREPVRPSDLFALRRVTVHERVSSSVPMFTFHAAGIERWLRAAG